MMPLPLSAGEITTAWLSSALSEWTPGVRVDAIEHMSVLPGTATKVLLKVRYAPESAKGEMPSELCVKGGFNENLRPFLGDVYALEASFYAEVARNIKAAVPRCWYAASDPANKQGVVVMDDLNAQDAEFGDPVVPWSVDLVAAGLEAQAAWHGPTWGATTKRFPSLPVGAYIRHVVPVYIVSENSWARMFGDEVHAARYPQELHDRRRVVYALQEMWRLEDDLEIPCVNHCDAHIGNTYLDAERRPHFIDWQVPSLLPGLDDVTYFIGGALTVADRRAHEHDLLKHYLQALAAHGGARLDFDFAWQSYRRHCMHGFLWTMSPPELQTAERLAVMTERYVAAILDHDALNLLAPN